MAGFEHKEVVNWPFDTFEMFGDSVQRHKQEERLLFISDMNSVISGVLGKDGAKALKEHMNAIESAARED